jgi:hypothetical protein
MRSFMTVYIKRLGGGDVRLGSCETRVGQHGHREIFVSASESMNALNPYVSRYSWLTENVSRRGAQPSSICPHGWYVACVQSRQVNERDAEDEDCGPTATRLVLILSRPAVTHSPHFKPRWSRSLSLLLG